MTESYIDRYKKHERALRLAKKAIRSFFFTGLLDDEVEFRSRRTAIVAVSAYVSEMSTAAEPLSTYERIDYENRIENLKEQIIKLQRELDSKDK
jgi:hypothetical protein